MAKKQPVKKKAAAPKRPPAKAAVKAKTAKAPAKKPAVKKPAKAPARKAATPTRPKRSAQPANPMGSRKKLGPMNPDKHRPLKSAPVAGSKKPTPVPKTAPASGKPTPPPPPPPKRPAAAVPALPKLRTRGGEVERAGRTLRMRMGKTLVHVFQENERLAKGEQSSIFPGRTAPLTDVEIRDFLRTEFPDRNLEQFRVSKARSLYNRGEWPRTDTGQPPEIRSQSYDGTGKPFTPRDGVRLPRPEGYQPPQPTAAARAVARSVAAGVPAPAAAPKRTPVKLGTGPKIATRPEAPAVPATPAPAAGADRAPATVGRLRKPAAVPAPAASKATGTVPKASIPGGLRKPAMPRKGAAPAQTAEKTP